MCNFDAMMKELPEGTFIEAPIFEMYVMPHGLLTSNPIEHALFFYYVNARRTYEEHVLDTPISMEGDSDPAYDFRSLLISIAGLYGVKPDEMVNAWDVIDRQCDLLELPKMPNEYQYRFVAEPTRIILQ